MFQNTVHTSHLAFFFTGLDQHFINFGNRISNQFRIINTLSIYQVIRQFSVIVTKAIFQIFPMICVFVWPSRTFGLTFAKDSVAVRTQHVVMRMTLHFAF